MLAPFTPFFDSDSIPKTDEEKRKENERQRNSILKQTEILYGDRLGDLINKAYSNAAKGIASSSVGQDFGKAVIAAGKYLNSITAKITGNEALNSGVNLNSTTPQYGASAKPVVYSDWSPASKLFGMNQETAFSEHLANTAHQREVADLKAAGLNPVLGISGSGASAVSGNAGVGSSSALKADENGFLDVLGATAAVITAVATKNPMYGYMVSNIFKAFD